MYIRNNIWKRIVVVYQDIVIQDRLSEDKKV